MRGKATFVLLAVLLMVITVAAVEPIALAVTDFEPLGVFPEQALAVAEILRTELIGFDGITVIERARLRWVFEELSLSQSGITTDDALQIGALAGADYVAVGALSALGSTYTVSVRLVEVSSSTALLGETTTVGAVENLPAAIKELARAIATATGGEVEVEQTVIEEPELPLRVKTLNLYRHGDYSLPQDSFVNSETRLVVWSLELTRSDVSEAETAEVMASWTTPEGEELWNETRQISFEVGESEVRIIGGKGYTEPGNWQLGDWLLTAYLNGVEVAESGFAIE